MNIKTMLTFDEKIIAAYLHYVKGVDQSIIAIAMGGVNHGRVNEACMVIKQALLEKSVPVRTPIDSNMKKAMPDE